jgi:hypothetical protein
MIVSPAVHCGRSAWWLATVMTPWYGADAVGGVRQTLSDTGTPGTPIDYNQRGTVESGTVPR